MDAIAGAGMDAQLVERWRSGDRQACAELFARYYDGIARFFRNKVPGRADDLIQRTFLGCFEGIERLNDPAKFRSFLFAIAHNVLREHLRERVHAPVDLESQRAIDLDPTPSALLAAREQQRLLIAALRHIPLAHQIVLELHYWEQMSGADIAEILDEPIGTIKTRLRRARQLLEQAISELAQSPSSVSVSMAELERWAAAVAEGLDVPRVPSS
jgi:RNA polymerase sigma factor (sigma-70 family)